MDPEELYKLIQKKLGVSDVDSGRLELSDKWARSIFCSLAKSSGLSVFDICQIVDRDYGTVNRDIRELSRLRLENDFISRAIVSEYEKLRSEILTNKEET